MGSYGGVCLGRGLGQREVRGILIHSFSHVYESRSAGWNLWNQRQPLRSFSCCLVWLVVRNIQTQGVILSVQWVRGSSRVRARSTRGNHPGGLPGRGDKDMQ